VVCNYKTKNVDIGNRKHLEIKKVDIDNRQQLETLCYNWRVPVEIIVIS